MPERLSALLHLNNPKQMEAMMRGNCRVEIPPQPPCSVDLN
jgi:hypothetical protein